MVLINIHKYYANPYFLWSARNFEGWSENDKPKIFKDSLNYLWDTLPEECDNALIYKKQMHPHFYPQLSVCLPSAVSPKHGK